MIPRIHENHPPNHVLPGTIGADTKQGSRRSGWGAEVRCLAYFSCSATAAEGDRSPPMRGECGVVDGEGE